MDLNFEQIKAITKGAVRVEKADGAYRFFRFTEAQTEVYRMQAEADPEKKHFYDKNFSTSGVRLVFETDSRMLAIKFEIRAGGSSRSYACFDLYQDGLMTDHCNIDYTHVHDGYIVFPLNEGKKTVELYLPWSAITILKSVELDDGASLAAVSRKHKMICFGDSITQGYDALYPSLSYASRIARLLDADEINKGIGGEIFNPPLAEVAESTEPDFVMVAYGTNDWGKRTPDELLENARAFYAALSANYPNARIFAISPVCRLKGNRTNTPFGAPCSNVDAVIAKACEGLPNVTHINGWRFTPHVQDFYADQWLHPNDLGFGLYASNLYRELIKYL